MEIPVILPARNEADHIGHTLDKLAKQNQWVEPIVVVNGSTDTTADIALKTGVIVIESDEGKIPAIQAGLRHLGKRALNPVLFIDADTRPLSDNWSRTLAGATEVIPHFTPAVAWAPVVFNGEASISLSAFSSVMSPLISFRDRNKHYPRNVRGSNMALKIHDAHLLAAILELPNYWPRADVAIYDTLKSYGAQKKVTFRPSAWAVTSDARVTENFKKFLFRGNPFSSIDKTYANDAPPGSVPYHSEYSPLFGDGLQALARTIFRR